MEWGWLKIFADKLRILTWIGALLVVAFTAVFYTADFWVLILVGTSSILLIELTIFSFKKHKWYIEKRRKKNEQIRISKKSISNREEKIWHLFIGLSDDNLKLAIQIFKSSIDPSNEKLRIIREGSNLYFNLYTLGMGMQNPFEIHSSNYWQIPCIWKERLGNSLIVHFDDYFYRLIEHYVKTKKKSKL